MENKMKRSQYRLCRRCHGNASSAASLGRPPLLLVSVSNMTKDSFYFWSLLGPVFLDASTVSGAPSIDDVGPILRY